MKIFNNLLTEHYSWIILVQGLIFWVYKCTILSYSKGFFSKHFHSVLNCLLLWCFFIDNIIIKSLNRNNVLMLLFILPYCWVVEQNFYYHYCHHYYHYGKMERENSSLNWFFFSQYDVCCLYLLKLIMSLIALWYLFDSVLKVNNHSRL